MEPGFRFSVCLKKAPQHVAVFGRGFTVSRVSVRYQVMFCVV